MKQTRKNSLEVAPTTLVQTINYSNCMQYSTYFRHAKLKSAQCRYRLNFS